MSMGKYTPQEYWPEDLKVYGADVIRAKMERKWRKAVLMTCEGTQDFQICLDHYIKADHALRVRKDRFEDLYSIYKDMGKVL